MEALPWGPRAGIEEAAVDWIRMYTFSSCTDMFALANYSEVIEILYSWRGVMCTKRWVLLSLCLLVVSASHAAGEAGTTTAIGEGQATATSADQALAARIHDAQGPEGGREELAYTPKQFDLSGLNGICDKTLEMQFKLY